MMTMTVEKALEVQARQVAHYAVSYPHVTELVAKATNIAGLVPGVEYDMVVINRAIPRGGKIEDLLGICGE